MIGQLIDLIYQQYSQFLVWCREVVALLPQYVDQWIEFFHQQGSNFLIWCRSAELLSLNQYIDLFYQRYSQYLNWYQGADTLTQYTVMWFSGVCLLLLSFIIVFSRITK